MHELTSSRLLRRHIAPFVVTLIGLTTLLVGSSARGGFSSGAESFAARAELLLLAMPATLALTIPMAVFVAVLWAFIRLGREGGLPETAGHRAERSRLLRPVTIGAAIIATLLLILNAEILPRANGRFSEIVAGGPVARTDRSMTLVELHEAARTARAEAGGASSNIANAYEVEFHKKLALAASCLFLALTAAVIGIRYHRAGFRVVLASSTVVFTVFYLSLVGGEALANNGRIPPFVAMWMANAGLIVVALLLSTRFGGSSDLRVRSGATVG